MMAARTATAVGAPGAAARGVLHVLVVAHAFPPNASIGTMRTLRLVRHLADAGWQVSVLTDTADALLPSIPIDMSLVARIPSGVSVIRAASWSGFRRVLRRPAPATATPATPRRALSPVGRLRSLAAQVAAVAHMPDRQAGWFAPAVMSGVAWSRAGGRPDVIYSSAPPWTGHLVAAVLARRLDRPWVADFRDPWARVPWRSAKLTALERRSAQRLERIVVRRADALIFATRANCADFAAYYGEGLRSRAHFVPNGCDPDDVAGPPAPAPASEGDEVFELLHAGSLYGGRDPAPLLRAIRRLVDRGDLDPGRFRLRLLGRTSLPGQDLAATVRDLGLEGPVVMNGPVSRDESLRAMRSASALLLLQPGTTVSVPGKLFEYLATGRPILALTEESETAELVRASGVGVAVLPDDEAAIAGGLLAVLAFGRRPLPSVPPALWDGRVRARETTEILERAVANRQALPDALTATA